MSTKYDINDIIHFITNGDNSELSEFSDEKDDNIIPSVTFAKNRILKNQKNQTITLKRR